MGAYIAAPYAFQAKNTVILLWFAYVDFF